MPRTPDEIKKGLDCCVDGNIVCAGNCVFDDDVKLGYPDCVKLLMTNALVYIQQLEKSLAFARDLADGLKTATVKQDQEIYKLQAERDAAVKDVRKWCCTCKHCAKKVLEAPCNSCRRNGQGGTEENWEWRGVQKEE